MGIKLSWSDFADASDEPDEASFAPPPPPAAPSPRPMHPLGRGARAAPSDAPPQPGSRRDVSAGPSVATPMAALDGPQALIARLRRLAVMAGDRTMPVIDLDASSQGFEDDVEPSPAPPRPGNAA